MPKRKSGFDLVDYIMRKKGLYEEGEPVADGTPSDEASASELEPANDETAPSEEDVMAVQEMFNKQSKKRRLSESKKPCKGCGGKTMKNQDNVIREWLRLGEEGDPTTSEDPIEGLSDEEAKADNAKTDVELAKEGGGQSPAAEIKEARVLRRKARRLREEADEIEAMADDTEEKAEEAKDEEDTEKLEERAILLRRKARRLREEAEETAEKAEEIVADLTAKSEEDEDTDEEASEEESAEAVNEWASVVAKTGKRIIKESRKRQLVKQLVKLVEEEEVGLGTPGQDLDAFGVDDDGTEKRAAVAAPTTEEELPE